jgi:uncharacterized protein YbaR (Trm112 family)
MKISKYIASAVGALAFFMGVSGCHTLDDDRIPPAAVNLTFYTVAEWNTYGVGGALDTRRFIKSERVPANYPYTALNYTGFGGLLLVCDITGNPLVYDLACPVECKATVRLTVDKEANVAECPQCHSTYDIFSLYGHPLSGKAAENGYGLKRYRIGTGSTEYMLITN